MSERKCFICGELLGNRSAKIYSGRRVCHPEWDIKVPDCYSKMSERVKPELIFNEIDTYKQGKTNHSATGIGMVEDDKEKEEKKQYMAQAKANLQFNLSEPCQECERLKKENELLNSYLIDIRSFLYYIRKEERKQ
jgi:hypothetical protein